MDKIPSIKTNIPLRLALYTPQLDGVGPWKCPSFPHPPPLERMSRNPTHPGQGILWTAGMLGTSLTAEEAPPWDHDTQARSITSVPLRVAGFPDNF